MLSGSPIVGLRLSYNSTSLRLATLRLCLFQHGQDIAHMTILLSTQPILCKTPISLYNVYSKAKNARNTTVVWVSETIVGASDVFRQFLASRRFAHQ
jgi:hypothetical protein